MQVSDVLIFKPGSPLKQSAVRTFKNIQWRYEIPGETCSPLQVRNWKDGGKKKNLKKLTPMTALNLYTAPFKILLNWFITPSSKIQSKGNVFGHTRWTVPQYCAYPTPDTGPRLNLAFPFYTVAKIFDSITVMPAYTSFMYNQKTGIWMKVLDSCWKLFSS